MIEFDVIYILDYTIWTLLKKKIQKKCSFKKYIIYGFKVI